MKIYKLLNEAIRNDFTICSRASNGLYILLKILNYKKKSIIFPDIMCHGPIVASLAAGYTPIFCDVDKSSFSLELSSLERILKTSNTKIVFAPHMYGYPCSLTSIAELCKKYNAFLIEDAAQAYGIHRFSESLLGIADATLYSFGHSKIIPIGEGGIVSSTDRSLLNEINRKYSKLTLYDEFDNDLIKNYKENYYNLKSKNHKAELLKLFLSLNQVYKKRILETKFLNSGLIFEDQIRIFEKRQELHKRQLCEYNISQVFETDSIVPWRLSFLFKGDRSRFLKFLRSNDIHCSSWYDRMQPYFLNSCIKLDTNSKYIEETIVNLWVDPSLPNEYYDKQIKFVKQGLKLYGTE
jgi:dTDP-4-amino-4,6-dideoxygalactose transaminase